MTTSRRDFVKLGALAGGLALGTGTASAKECADWSVEVVESTMRQYTPETLGGWGYTRGLYLWGQWLVFQRTKNKKYFDFIKAWVDRFVGPDGRMNRTFTNLDAMRAGQLLPLLYTATGDVRYRTASTQIRERLNTYARTKEGGFWHAEGGTRDWQNWSDGVYMVVPFIMRHGHTFAEKEWANAEAVKQLLVYAKNLQHGSGLFHHAYDESRTVGWADPVTGVSPEFWGRAMGWYAITVCDVLEDLPRTHPDRPKLIAILGRLIAALAKYQDRETGRWFQVVDKGSNPQNWTETSCSSMYSMAISRAVERGYVSRKYDVVARRGYRGVLDRVTVNAAGNTEISEICIGTNVGDLPFYLARPRAVNDLHGIGAFLIMNEQFQRR
ncbi:glycoside hydrolase family 88/105 protein [Lentzea sp. NPDC004789]